MPPPYSIGIIPDLDEATAVAKKAVIPLQSGSGGSPPPPPKTSGQLWPK